MPPLNFFMLLSLIVLKNQCAIGGRKLVKAAIQTGEQFFLFVIPAARRMGDDSSRAWLPGDRKFLQVGLSMLRMPDIFQENKFCGYVTIMGGRKPGNLAFVAEFLRNASESFIGQFIGGEAVLAIKVGGQPAVHFQVFLTA